MIYHLYMSAAAAIVCAFVIVVLKYISISKTRLDNRDQKKKVTLSTIEVLTLLRNLKPFPVGTHKGWKLHSVQQSVRVWTQLLSHGGADLHIYGAFTKVRIPAQLVLQILNDVTKTTSWKPGCLATSITFKPPDSETGTRAKRMQGGIPVQHDVVMEESSLDVSSMGVRRQVIQYILMLIDQNNAPHTFTKEHRRYWHREDNGVCWHLQMAERHQQWLFFLAQPVEAVDKCLLTVIGYNDNSHSAKHVAEILSSLREYITFRKSFATPFIDIKLPSDRSQPRISSTSSSDEAAYTSPGKRMFLRFRSLVEKRSFSSEKFHGAKKQLVKSASILHHRNSPFLDLPNDKTVKTRSLDRNSINSIVKLSPRREHSAIRPRSHSLKDSNRPKLDGKEDTASIASMPILEPGIVVTSVEHNNNQKVDLDNNVETREEQSDSNGESEMSDTETGKDVDAILLEDIRNFEETCDSQLVQDTGKDIDTCLQEDFKDYEESYENTNGNSDAEKTDSKEDIQQLVAGNQAAADLLAVAVQASNIDLSKSIEQQVANSGGWMFCGLDNDVVVLKKISLQESVHCYLGKGVIQASPTCVWNAIRNPRTKFTYDDSLKKVDVLETLSDSIKVVYYYHEVLQLFKKECCDMVVTQSEKQDGDKYVLAMLSTDRDVPTPDGTVRVKVLPSGWIIEPVTKDKKLYSMATYIMQIDFGTVKQGIDKTPFEDLVAKQPRSISYLRQYLRPSAIWAEGMAEK